MRTNTDPTKKTAIRGLAMSGSFTTAPSFPPNSSTALLFEAQRERISPALELPQPLIRDRRMGHNWARVASVARNRDPPSRLLRSKSQKKAPAHDARRG